MLDDQKWMRLAIEAGHQNPKAPFGTILVELTEGQEIARGVNHSADNPIMHGEIDALNRCAEFGWKTWENLCLYTTAEPCCMCQAAILWSRIPRVVYGTSIATLRQFGWNQFELTSEQVTAAAPFARCEIISGVLEMDCDELFRQATIRKH